MERAFKRKGWKEVSYAELDHGDIIVWSSRFLRGKECTGNGSCYIGVYMGWGLSFDNDGKFGFPFNFPVIRAAYVFKTAFRPRD